MSGTPAEGDADRDDAGSLGEPIARGEAGEESRDESAARRAAGAGTSGGVDAASNGRRGGRDENVRRSAFGGVTPGGESSAGAGVSRRGDTSAPTRAGADSGVGAQHSAGVRDAGTAIGTVGVDSPVDGTGAACDRDRARAIQTAAVTIAQRVRTDGSADGGESGRRDVSRNRGVSADAVVSAAERVAATVFDVTVTRFDILGELRDAGNLAPRHVAARVDVSKPYARNEMSDLVDAGLVEAVPPVEEGGLYRLTTVGLAAVSVRGVLEDRVEADTGRYAAAGTVRDAVDATWCGHVAVTLARLDYQSDAQHTRDGARAATWTRPE